MEFMLAYLKAMGHEATQHAGWLLGIRALLVSTLLAAVAAGTIQVTASLISSIGFWLLVGLVVWFVAEFLILAPARSWRIAGERMDDCVRISETVLPGYMLTIDHHPGSTQTSATVTTPSAAPRRRGRLPRTQ